MPRGQGLLKAESGPGRAGERRHGPGQAPAGSTQKPRGLLVTMPPRSTKALEMLLKFRKSSCCCGSDCRAAMVSRTRAAAWGQGRRCSGWRTPALSRTPALGNPKPHLDTPAVTEHLLMLGCRVALAQGSGGPGQNYHHGVEVNGTVCQALQHELFICQVDGMGWDGDSREGKEGRNGSGWGWKLVGMG